MKRVCPHFATILPVTTDSMTNATVNQISLQHTAADVDEHLDAFADLAPDLARAQP